MIVPLTLIIQTIVTFVCITCFSIILNVPKKELLFCGLTGAVGWFASRFVLILDPNVFILANFVGTLALTAVSRVLSYARKTPVLVYLIGGILPLVPGAGIYYTVYEFIINNNDTAGLLYGIETAKVTGVIAIGIICILSLPRFMFDYRRKRRV